MAHDDQTDRDLLDRARHISQLAGGIGIQFTILEDLCQHIEKLQEEMAAERAISEDLKARIQLNKDGIPPMSDHQIAIRMVLASGSRTLRPNDRSWDDPAFQEWGRTRHDPNCKNGPDCERCMYERYTRAAPRIRRLFSIPIPL